jgi:hypothetical protein
MAQVEHSRLDVMDRGQRSRRCELVALLTPRAGWIGLAAAMVGVIASWFREHTTQRNAIIVGAAAVVFVLVMTAWRGDLIRRRDFPGRARRLL